MLRDNPGFHNRNFEIIDCLGTVRPATNNGRGPRSQRHVAGAERGAVSGGIGSRWNVRNVPDDFCDHPGRKA